MTDLKCNICGKKIDTISLCCGYSINVNKKTNEWECYMGPEIGYMKLNELICSKCLIIV